MKPILSVLARYGITLAVVAIAALVGCSFGTGTSRRPGHATAASAPTLSGYRPMLVAL